MATGNLSTLPVHLELYAYSPTMPVSALVFYDAVELDTY
jgi:hypothetical protein